MRISLLLVSALLITGCATAPAQPEFVTFALANRPLAESGQLKWSDYYLNLYRVGARSGMAVGQQSRVNDLISYAQQYERGSMTKDEFENRRRLAQIAGAEDAERAREMDQARWRAAAAAISATTSAQQNIIPYQIVPPAQMQGASNYQLQPVQTAGVTAMWTGKQHQVQTVTNQFGWSCEYNYAGRTFTRVFTTTCPSSVQVQ